MKFSWKVFFSTIIMMLITFSIGGYFLISALFQSAYNREINNAKEENKILQLTLATVLSTVTSENVQIMNDVIIEAADSMVNHVGGSKTQIKILNQEFKTVYSSKETDSDTKILHEINTNIRGYMVKREGNSVYVITACKLQFANKGFYIESFKDISSIYKERDKQYQIYMKLLLILIFVNGIISYLLSLWLTYPIKRVSKVAHEISEGNLNDRVKIKSEDEIGKLARDFNRMTDSLENKINELEDITHRQEDFIGSVAHEIKTPLTSIIGYADILRSKKLTPEMTMMSADYIFKEGNRLEALSLKLLELIVLKKVDLNLKKVNAKMLLEEVSGLVNPVLIKEKINFDITVEEAILFVEPDLMKTVLINLIDNAKKALEGTTFDNVGNITIQGKKEVGGYSIYIKDNGKGIPEDELNRITDAFYMVDKSRAREQGGAGLGLAICSAIIKQHDGRLEFDSVLGMGTTVHLFIKEGVV